MATDYQYAVYEGTLTTDTTFAVASDMGVNFAKGGYIINDDPLNSMGVKFSFGGTTFGDTITVKLGEQLNFDIFPQYKSIRLIHLGSNVPYRIVVIATEDL